jgi:hypothetical protein
MKRRAFLQQAGLAVATWGLSEASLSVLASRYQQVLAASTNRKLALLVGINQYRAAPLSGCVTDVELQRELLIHRFGFQPQDILTLTDQQATRDAIESAFVSHLIQQAQSGDVVVFHFSGYGGNVALGTSPEFSQTSLVPADGQVVESEPVITRDVLEDTLWLLVRSLSTDRITTVLDTSFIYPGKSLQGNLRIRARPSLLPLQPDQAELAFQQQLAGKIFPRPSIPTSPHPALPGVLLSATAPGQMALEARWNGFSAGLFTYALTRTLWEAASATKLQVIFSRTRMQIEQLASEGQQPQLGGQKSQTLLQPYFLPLTVSGANGAIMEGEDGSKTVQLWLGGLPTVVLEHYAANSLLTLIDHNTSPNTDSTTFLQILSREGLTARAKVLRVSSAFDAGESSPPLKVGQFVRERVRVLPHNIGLTVALDSSLERIERVDAISAFTAIPRVSSAIAGEQAADYLFSKVPVLAPTQIASATNLTGIVTNPPPTQSSYGLFSLAQNAIPNTAGDGGEAVKFAVRRLVPKLQTLLAAKLLNLTVNETSSQLAVRITLEKLDPQPQAVLYHETSVMQAGDRAVNPASKRNGNPVPVTTDGLLSLPIGSRIQYRLENNNPQPLYFILLGLDSSGNLIALYAPSTQSGEPPSPKPGATDPVFPPEEPSVPPAPALPGSIAPDEVITLPRSLPASQWTLNGPPGITETYLICCRTPFTQTQALLAVALHAAGNNPAFYPLPNPLEIAQAVLQDLHQASDIAAKVVGATPESFALDVKAWAGLRFVYQVV